ncbi:hypothetical protein Cgig2_011382 [Carnegiea gigantea]|uniref:Replication protein A 32 kDa subunit n=1 Tax=Carnegiea gigantea TaxID=171969 RepID=A0A9Q1KTX0_9CARY|nr:hypothetical protein Cgig2_011382 [Carnegiea gigantea]
MMFSSQYDGGFTSSQLTQSDSGPSPAAKSRDPQGVVPLTVKQISQASPSSADDKSSLQIDGVDVTNVKLVGMVFDKTEKVTDVSFTLDDGTGRIGCKRWVNEAFDRRQMEAIGNGMYVSLVGHLRTFKNDTEIVAFNVRPVSNFDEVTLHYVECIYQHMQNKKSQVCISIFAFGTCFLTLNVHFCPSPRGDSLSQSQMAESSQSTPVKSESNGFRSSPPNQFSMQMSVDGLKDIDQRVLDYLQQPASLAQEKGVHRDEIARHLKLSVDKIMQSITCLEDEGLIYSTIDEFHFNLRCIA